MERLQDLRVPAKHNVVRCHSRQGRHIKGRFLLLLLP